MLQDHKFMDGTWFFFFKCGNFRSLKISLTSRGKKKKKKKVLDGRREETLLELWMYFCKKKKKKIKIKVKRSLEKKISTD